ncbi:MAG: type II toxin-antitoxin system HicA family toxin [Bacteroidales bacterium]|nr:type II toxin-antitoxin system HicA family toxin [Bacteroidales bacterium]
MKYSEIHRKLKKAGCYIYSDKTAEPTWYSPITGKTFRTSHHESQEAKGGTFYAIQRDSGVRLK